MFTSTYVNCLLSLPLSNFSIFGRFQPKLPRFFSLFLATLVTFHKATFAHPRGLPYPQNMKVIKIMSVDHESLLW